MSSDDVRAIVVRFRELEARLERAERLIANIMREGRVTKTDYPNGMIEVEMDGLASRMIPFAQRAGNVSDWDPPTEGERVLVFSPGGDPARAIAMHGGWTENFPAPDDKGGNRTITTTGEFKVASSEGMTFDGRGKRVRFV